MALVLLVAAGFVAAALAPWAARHEVGRRWLGPATGALALLLGLALLLLARAAPEVALPWVPPLGVELALRLDGLGLLFGLIVTGVGAAVLVYAGAYLQDDPLLGRFFGYLLAFMASMLGLVLADDLVTLFVFFELTSLASYLLIAHEHERREARAAAQQALLITTVGGLCLLVALLLVQETAGTLRISELRPENLREGPYLAILVLVAAAAFTKSAQAPLHPWLPAAMAAPTPVSAYLHSAAMVKAGVFVLARLSPALGGTPAWTALLASVGAVTAIAGAWLALRETDLKRVLAYTTVSALGLLTLLLGIGGRWGAEAFVAYALGHALYKSALFMVAGAIDHAAGTRDVLALRGLAGPLPALALVCGAAAWSFAGLPLSLGFVGKELAYEAALLAGGDLVVGALVVAVGLASAGMAAAACLVAVRPFRRRPHLPAAETAQRAAAHPPALGLWGPPAACAAVGLVLGVLPWLLDPLASWAAGSITGAPVAAHLEAWHGLTPALGLSTVSAIVGVGTYVAWDHVRGSAPLRALGAALDRAPARAYDLALAGTLRLAGWQTRTFQTGNLRDYLAVILGTLVVLGGLALLRVPALDLPAREALPARDWLVVVLLVLAALAACAPPVRFATIVALSIVGYAAALVYQSYGAPDLALVQVLVETLVVILFVLVLADLPLPARARPRGLRAVRDVAIALGAGIVVAAAMLAVLTAPFDDKLGRWYAHNAVDLAHGRNVVNTIIVDFRAFDTLGEVIVVVVASVGVTVLLRGVLRASPEPAAGPVPQGGVA